MGRFIKDIKKYSEYIWFAARSDLRREVAGSYLSWIWWILDPILFMLVYTFVVQFVFGGSREDFPVFVFIGLNCWNFFNAAINTSVSVIRSFRAIISRVYVPKYIFILVKMLRNLIKMGISFALVLIMMGIFKIQFSFNILYVFPITIVLFVVTFALSLIVAHIGAFITDFSNIVNVILRVLFYLSGVLYSVGDRIPEPYRSIMFLVNPPSVLIEQYRNVLMYQTPPNFFYLTYWLVVSLIITYIGLSIMYKYENTYVKVV
ncbi:ABC transporter permease [bacterium]|nr:ABC transporter permease [bacterium]